MPELGCIAGTLSSAEPLSFDEKLLFARHLLTQCRRDYDVIFLPNETPTDDGLCPVDSCRADVQKMTKKRSPHIHECVRRDMAQRLLTEWRDRHCEVILYRYTVIRPGYCPCCLWNQEIPPDDRVKYWLRSAGLRKHIQEEHIEKVEWPTIGPICGCSESFASERDFRYHLHDVHGLADGIWKPKKAALKRKRAAKGPPCVDEKAQEPKPEKIRFRHYQPLNQHLQTADSHGRSTTIHTLAGVPTQTNVTFWEYPCPPSNSSSGASGSSTSESNTADISAPSSPLSSLRTTADLELIDPRILDPLWPGNGGPPSIDGTCDASDPAACANNGDKSTIREEMADDPTFSQLDARRINNNRLDQEVPRLVQKMGYLKAPVQAVGRRLYPSTVSVKPHPFPKDL